MMQPFSMMEMQYSSIKVLHHERGANGKPICEYPPIDGMQVAQ